LLFSNNCLHAQNWQELNDSLSYYFERSDFNTAVPVARKIAAMAQKESGDSSESYGTALNNLAFLQQKINDNKGAENNYRKSMDIRLQLHSPDHDDCLSVVQGLCSVLQAQGRTGEAIKTYSRYLERLDETGKQQSRAAILIRYRRAEIFLEAEQPEQARPDLIAITKTA
jgi:tetratricopeptide (TPR) repeat protein